MRFRRERRLADSRCQRGRCSRRLQRPSWALRMPGISAAAVHGTERRRWRAHSSPAARPAGRSHTVSRGSRTALILTSVHAVGSTTPVGGGPTRSASGEPPRETDNAGRLPSRPSRDRTRRHDPACCRHRRRGRAVRLPRRGTHRRPCQRRCPSAAGPACRRRWSQPPSMTAISSDAQSRGCVMTHTLR